MSQVAVLILAGGGGTRLWPLSRNSAPKPLLPIAGGRSPMHRAVELARNIAGQGRTWIVTNRAMGRKVRQHLGRQRCVKFILEPCPRDTAAAMALGVAVIQKRCGADWVLCIPADQWIRRPAALRRCVRAITHAAVEDWLITFGVKPTFANPGYGYIQLGKKLEAGLFAARRFVEKPPRARAARYVRSGRWVWNSGMFLWRPENFLAEVERLLPEVSEAVKGLSEDGRTQRKRAVDRWRELEAVSVDHGVLERARRVAVGHAHIGWSDLGSWDALAGSLMLSRDGTRHLGQYLGVDGGNCIVYAPDHLTVNLGARRVGLVVTGDCILLFDRDQHQQVRLVSMKLNGMKALRRFA